MQMLQITSKEEDQEDDEDNLEEEEEELAGGGGGVGGQSEIDLSGIMQVLQKRLSVPQGRIDIKPGRFKFNSNINSNRFKTSNKMHVKPARFNNSFRPSRWRR
jgi:hypothetical protein